MRQLAKALGLSVVVLLPIGASAQTVEEVFEAMIRAENAGLDSVDNYVLKTELMGFSTVEYFERTAELELANGETAYVMRSVPLNQIQERQSPDNPISNASAEELRQAADMVGQAGIMMEQGMQQEMAGSGLGGGLIGGMMMNPPSDQPWLSSNPRDMTSMYATMLRGVADAKEAQAAEDPEADAERRLGEMTEVMARTAIIGRETIDGRPAIGLSASDLDFTQAEAGQEFTLDTVTMWVDAERYVPLRLRMDGVMRIEGESRPVRIERDDLDYRTVAGCGEMYEPARSVMRIAGIMTPEQEAQMAEAEQQLAEAEEQLAALPESQRALVMRQLGPQLEMLERMTAGNGIEVESRIVELRCNAGLPGAMEIAMTTFGGGALGAGGAARDEPEPYYVDEAGIGVIRHAGDAGEYFLEVKRGGDVLAGPMGPFAGPDVGVFIGSLNMMGVPLAELELELYQADPRRTAVTFRPVVDAERAETAEDCGTVSPLGACSD